MKQFITEEQFSQLTLPQQIKLQKLIRGDIMRRELKYFEVTIGQMIELLQSKIGRLKIVCSDDGEWNDLYFVSSPEIAGIEIDEMGSELVDALWEAVKFVLGDK